MSVRPPPLHEKTPHLRQTSFTTKLSLRQNHNACKYSGRFLGLPVSQKLFQPSLRRKNVENFLTTKPLPRPRGKVFVIQYREAQKTSRIFACVMQRIIAANKGVCENIDFGRILTKFAEFLLCNKRKMAFWRPNFLKPIYNKKHSILDGEKMAKFGIYRIVFDKVCIFWLTKK